MQKEPSTFPPYSGQNQQQVIEVPRSISNREERREEGPWVMPPYANLYPGGEQARLAYLPPPIQSTDLWTAMQTFPL
jgi:hypothetical protein